MRTIQIVALIAMILSGCTRRAINKINSMHPGDVYKKLKTRLPYGETRTYLRNVVNARREFVEL